MNRIDGLPRDRIKALPLISLGDSDIAYSGFWKKRRSQLVNFDFLNKKSVSIARRRLRKSALAYA